VHREPVFNIPSVVLVLLAVMAVVQVWREFLPEADDIDLIARFAFVPGRFTFVFDHAGVVERVSRWAASANAEVRRQGVVAGFFIGDGFSKPWTLLTYAFLHGNWAHLGLNSVWMLAFGTPVARRFGSARFLAFMAVTAVAGAVAHWLCFPFGFSPVIGASAAVSGLMGAALRFMFHRSQRGSDPEAASSLTLYEVFRDRRTLSFLAVWFVTNGLFGVGSEAFGITDAPVAWQAHVGGFVAGLFLFPLFDPPWHQAPSSREDLRSASVEPSD
jgi:membrane associated rhomboid family serine protease